MIFLIDNQEEMLVKPEFEGLWNKKLKAYDVDDLYKTQFKFPPSFKSKAERVKKKLTNKTSLNNNRL